MRWGPWGFGWNGPHQEPPPFWCKPKRGSCTHTGPHTPRSVPGVHFEPLQTRPVWKRANTTISRSEPPWSRHNHSKVLASRLFTRADGKWRQNPVTLGLGKKCRLHSTCFGNRHMIHGVRELNQHTEKCFMQAWKKYSGHTGVFFFYTCTFPSGE